MIRAGLISLASSVGLLLGTLVAAPADFGKDQPNIVVVLTDDQGFADLSAHGHPVLKTPNLDRLERESRSFVNFFVSPTCAPTRSALMTGRHEFLNGVTHTILERERLTLQATTLAEVLQQAGYATGIFGKWHLGDEAEYRPDRRGFEETFIHGGGGIGQSYPGSCGDAPGNTYYDPWILHGGRFEKQQGFCTDVFFGKALEWMDKVRESRPFFCWIATNAPHDPYHAKVDDAMRYSGMGLDARQQNFFGMLHNIDDQVGRLVEQLDRWRPDDDTLLIFMNDNGSAMGSLTYNAGMRGAKGSPWLGGTRANSFWRWPGHIQPGPCNALTSHIDVFPTLARIAGAPLPDRVQSQVQGRNLMPLLQDPATPWPDRTLVTHVGRWPKGSDPNDYQYRQCAIRNHQYTLVSVEGGREPHWELFDVIADPGQTNNILERTPEVADALAKEYDRWWASMQSSLVNESASGPSENPFRALFREQMPSARLDPSGRVRPNIVWIVVEDMSPDFSCYGETAIATPNVDRLASQGVLFSRAFTTAPICSTSRSALITGRYQTSIGAHHHRSSVPGHRIQLDPSVRLVPESLRGVGYHCNNLTIEDFLKDPSALDKESRVAVAKTDYNFEWDEKANYDPIHWSRRDPGQPFFVQIQLHGGKFRGQEPRPEWPARVRRELGSNVDADAFTLPPYLPEDPVIRQDWAQYLDCVRYTDDQVGRILRRLEESGDLDFTYLFFLTDHGISHVRNKQFLYDGGTRIPLIVRGPGLAAGSTREDLVEHIDIAATSIALAGENLTDSIQGRSLFSSQPGQKRVAVFAARDRADETVDAIRSVRTERYKYIRNGFPSRPYLQPNAYKDSKAIVKAMRALHAQGLLNQDQARITADTRPLEELYDLNVDPNELNNLASQPELQSVLDSMRSQLATWRQQTGDPIQPEDASTYEQEAAAEHVEGGKSGQSIEYRNNLDTMRRWRTEKPFVPFP